MPSYKEPSEVVQPGPGKAGVASVSAAALDFDPASGLTVGSISTGAYGSLRRSASGTLDGALADIYTTLNSQAVWVVDVNGDETNADWYGPNAFTDAILAAGGDSKILFLRSGSYTWDASSELDDVHVIGSALGTAVITSSGDIKIGRNCCLQNLTLRATGDLNVKGFAGVGRNRIERCKVATGGAWRVSCPDNFFSQCLRETAAAVHLIVTQGNNTFEMLNVSQLSSSTSVGANVYRAITVNNTPKTPSSPVVTIADASADISQMVVSPTGILTSHGVLISGGANRISQLTIGSISAASGSALSITGANNSLAHLTIASCIVTGSTCLLGGANNNITDLIINGGNSASGRTLEITNGAQSIHNALIAPITNQAGSIVYNTSDGSRLSQFAVIACTTTASGSHVVYDAGKDLTVDGLRLASCGTTFANNSLIRIDTAATNSSFRNVRLDQCSVGNTAAGVVYLGGTSTEINDLNISGLVNLGAAPIVTVANVNGSLSGLTFTQSTALLSPLILISAAGSKVSNVKSLGMVMGAGGQLMRLLNASNCVVDGLSVTNSPVFATTIAWVTTDACRTCQIRNVAVDNVGTTTPFAHSLFAGSGTAVSSEITLEDWSVSNVVRSGSALFDVDPHAFRGLRMSRILADTNINSVGAAASAILKLTSISTVEWPNDLVVESCRFSNPNIPDSTVRLSAVSSPVEFRSCFIESLSTTNVAMLVNGCTNVTVHNTVIKNAGAVQCVGSGLKLSNCTLLSNNLGVSRQILSGYGASQSQDTRGLIIKDCTVLLTAANMNTAPSGTTQPIVFLGGTGSTAASSHGEIHVDGLIIKPEQASLSSIANWHNGVTLAIDVANQRFGAMSSFRDIVVDMRAIETTGSGTSASTFGADLGPYAGVIEIRGPSSVGKTKTLFHGISVLSVNRGGGTERMIIKALGVRIEGLTIDAASGATAAAPMGGTVALFGNCSVSQIDMYPTRSLWPGLDGNATHIYASQSTIDHLKMRNFEVAAAEQNYLVYLMNSTLTDSEIDMSLGSHIGSASDSCIITAYDRSRVARNRVTFVHHATSINDMRRAIRATGDGPQVIGNFLENSAAANSSSYSSTPASSNGGGCQLLASFANGALIAENSIRFQWATGSALVNSIVGTSCSTSRFALNSTVNTADNTYNAGGTNAMRLDGGNHCVVNGNYVEGLCYASGNNYIALDTLNNESSAVLGNIINNLATSQNGGLYTTDTDKPPSIFGTAGDLNLTS